MIEEKIKILAERIKSHSSAMITEEAVKTAVVLPFFAALGYDIFNPSEVIPEFTADAVGKKGEKVDYAIKVDDKIRILVECKPIAVHLDKVHLAQLYRYFSVTSAKFALLTNGRHFQLHTDLDEPNKLDPLPFLKFDLSDINASILSEIKKFGRNEFDIPNILASASRLKYTSEIKTQISSLMESPTEEFVRQVTAGLYEGRFTSAVKDMLTPLVKNAFREVVRDSVQSRLSSALADTEVIDVPVSAAEPNSDEVVTTAEEMEGFHIVRAIVRDIIRANRVIMRDQKSYCGIIIDNNNRKPLARLHFNRSVKYVSFFDKNDEERIRIQTLDDIYDHAQRLRDTAAAYAEGKNLVLESPVAEQGG
ncbi:type I restriction enzyme HsdR N-terminal domain-containing protein [Hansschlegelia plantiphila]|uniref:Restriction endonuclease or methylase n=1 Tax=Hansschlegelia plantiphila TaxID=374655 RepID=A0A9W6J5C2_9HYPH|nr:type I restriction enzyme HsdR N-terminal domain-containing protein [Hansschlegelia plantiphila]GLK69634.1 restriction endonuclease or methylase [Hansschlegelia plantiphila]